jgi:endonuclease/exonuclease/phosphatase family metal-dependent hydrolase/protein tyrosine phosphatase (PTP) superfamily phosphohydrolase (DUF442 family)
VTSSRVRAAGMPSARAPLALLALFLPVILLVSCGRFVLYPDPSGPRYEGVFAPRPDRDSALRVVTFNIEHARHIDRAIALLEEDPHLRGADLVFLQEMDAAGTERIAQALGLSYVYFPAVVHPSSDHDFGNAVLSRWPVRDVRKIVLPHLARLAHSQRIATACTVDMDGQAVRLYSVHAALPFTVSGKGRREQMRAIVDDAADLPGRVIVAGDLNSHGLGGYFANTGFEWASRRVGSTEGWFDVDQVFLRGFRLVAPESIGVVRDNRGASDHRPLWAVLAADSVPRLPRGGYRFAAPDTTMPIKRFRWIEPTLARGARPDGAGIAALRQRGFRTIVDFTANAGVEREAKAAGIEYFALPMTAHLWSRPPGEEQVRTFFRIALDPARRPLFIHCTHGVDRTGTMAALYRIEAQGWSTPAAVEEMQLLGYHGWYHALIDYVRGYVPRGYGSSPDSTRRAADGHGMRAR